jgi:hypothetical protein
MKVKSIKEWSDEFKQNKNQIVINGEKEYYDMTFFAIHYGSNMISSSFDIKIDSDTKVVEVIKKGNSEFLKVKLNPNNDRDMELIEFFKELDKAIETSIDHGLNFYPTIKKNQDKANEYHIYIAVTKFTHISFFENPDIHTGSQQSKTMSFSDDKLNDLQSKGNEIKIFFNCSLWQKKNTKILNTRAQCSQLQCLQSEPVEDQYNYEPNKENEIIDPSVYGYGIDLSI